MTDSALGRFRQRKATAQMADKARIFQANIFGE
jgi:hypothetical protein